jgi:L-aspartate oxidase
LPAATLQDLRRRMAANAGVVRDAARLERLIAWLGRMDEAHGLCLPLIAARLVAEAALGRRESRGAHFRADFPASDTRPVHTVRVLDSGYAARRRAA